MSGFENNISGTCVLIFLRLYGEVSPSYMSAEIFFSFIPFKKGERFLIFNIWTFLIWITLGPLVAFIVGAIYEKNQTLAKIMILLGATCLIILLFVALVVGIPSDYEYDLGGGIGGAIGGMLSPISWDRGRSFVR